MAEQCVVSPTRTLNRNVASLGDGIGPVGESRADVDMGTEEDEEPLRAEIPRVNNQRETRTRRFWTRVKTLYLSRNVASKGATSILCGRLLLCELRSAALHQTTVMQEARDERESLIGVACVHQDFQDEQANEIGHNTQDTKTRYTNNLNQKAGD